MRFLTDPNPSQTKEKMCVLCTVGRNIRDLGSRGETIVNMERGSWFTGPDWVYWVNNKSNSMGAKVH